VITGVGVVEAGGRGRRQRRHREGGLVVARDDPQDPPGPGSRDAAADPIVYLVDSAGVNLPYQGGVFPGQYGAARIFYYNSIMRRYLHVPQRCAR
jgi:hypothetical protein